MCSLSYQMSGPEITTASKPEGPGDRHHEVAVAGPSSSLTDDPTPKDAYFMVSENCENSQIANGFLASPTDPPIVQGSSRDVSVEKERNCGSNGEQVGTSTELQTDVSKPPPSNSVMDSVPESDGNNCTMPNSKKQDGIHGPIRRRLTRSSCYRGVSRNRWTGRFEAHLWDGTFQMEGRKRKGKLVYLGGYDSEEIAGRTHDLAAIKYWGPGSSTKLNFSVSDYCKEMEEMKSMSREEYVASLIRRSSCFSRGASIYRGVTRKKDGRWQARIGRIADRKDIYLGTYNTEEEAAEAYDIAAVRLKGLNAVTNFDISNYSEDLEQMLDPQ